MRRLSLWLAVLGIGGASLFALRWFDHHPIVLDRVPHEAAVSGARPPECERGDIALILSVAPPSEPPSFRSVDLSCGWLNLLEAEVGAVSVVAPGAALDGFRAAVLADSAADRIDIGALRRFVAGGGVLFIDAPQAGRAWHPELLELAGVTAAGSRAFPAAELLPEGAVDPADRRAFDSVPFFRPAQIADLRPASADVAAAGALLYERRSAAGKVVIAALPIGRWFTTMVQGTPSDDSFALRQRLGDYDDIVEPDDLVADARLRENELPYADLLARAISARLDPPDAWPVPHLLWFPAGSSGIYLMTHDEDFRGGARSLQLAELDRDLGLRGTTFVIAVPRVASDFAGSTDYAAAIEAIGGAVDLHWNQYPMSNGIGPIEPVQYRMSCAEQSARLRGMSPATLDYRANRNHYLILHDDWTRMFRVLAAQGVRLDSTFGANKGRGYLFGTARPYTILDNDGLPLPIRELPFVNQEDWGGADQAYFQRLFEANAARHHGMLVSIFHPHLIVTQPAGRKLFEAVAGLSHATHHRSWNFEELLDFWDQRGQAVIRSRVEGDALVVRCEVARDDFMIALPVDDLSATLDGAAIDVGSLRIGARDQAIVRLPAGAHELRIRR